MNSVINITCERISVEHKPKKTSNTLEWRTKNYMSNILVEHFDFEKSPFVWFLSSGSQNNEQKWHRNNRVESMKYFSKNSWFDWAKYKDLQNIMNGDFMIQFRLTSRKSLTELRLMANVSLGVKRIFGSEYYFELNFRFSCYRNGF